MNRKLLCALLVLHLTGAVALATLCRIEEEKILSPTSLVLTVTHDGDAKPVQLQDFPILNQFKEAVNRRTNSDPYVILENQRARFKGFGSEFVKNYDLILAKKVDGIKEMSCLDALLLEKHFMRFPDPIANPSEFGAYALSLKNPRSLVILFTSTKELGVAEDLAVLAKIDALVSQGYQNLFHLHNHPFSFDNPTGDIGGSLIPSGLRKEAYGDLGYYDRFQKTRKLEQIRITNGIHTLRIRTTDLPQFE